MTDARDVIATQIARYGRWCVDERTDAVVAALAAAGLSITATPAWEWNVRGHNSTDLMLNAWVDEDEARGWLDPRFNRVVVRRQKAGREEVAP